MTFDDCLTTAWWLFDNWLMTAWQPPEDSLTTTWWLLMTNRWQTYDPLRTNYQNNWRTTYNWLTTDYVVTTNYPSLTTNWPPHRLKTERPPTDNHLLTNRQPTDNKLITNWRHTDDWIVYKCCSLKSLTLEAIPSATQFFKRAYKISHFTGL